MKLGLKSTMELPKECICSMYTRWLKNYVFQDEGIIYALYAAFSWSSFFFSLWVCVQFWWREKLCLVVKDLCQYNLIWSTTFVTIFTSLDTHKPYMTLLFSSIYSSEWCLEPIIFTDLGKHKFGHSCTCEGQWSHVL